MGTGGVPEGFEASFDVLYRRAFLVARRIVPSPAAAEDVAAETMMRAYARWRKIAGRPVSKET